ncbi:MAG TPA: PepSY domain-containing protein [Woeseiaceae bacterium]|nr:PepSY domain-containing protein [Woeseiaceae bacterium]
MHPKAKLTVRGKHWARRTHRLVAVNALLFLLLLALSGLLLNHANSLGLTDRYPPGGWQEFLYGLEPPGIDAAFAAGGIVFASVNNVLYADGKKLADLSDELRGVVAGSDGIVIATASELLLATNEAQLVERFSPALSSEVDRIGGTGQAVVLLIGAQYFYFDVPAMRLGEPGQAVAGSVDWSTPATLSKEQQDQLVAAALGELFSWERVLIDFHSGRILPVVGRYLADLAALCLIYLCLTGLLLWFRRR